MQKRIALRIVFLGLTFLVMQPACAADSMADLPDITGTPASSTMKEFAEFLLTNPSEQELQAYVAKAAPFIAARDDSSEQAKLGALFKRLKKAAVVEGERDNLKDQLMQARQQIEAMKGAQKEDDQQQKTSDAEIAALGRYARNAKIGIGCMSTFIIVDKVIIPLVRKCRLAWKKRQDKHKRPDAWTALRSRFERKM